MIQSPVLVQLSPDAKAAISRWKEGASRKVGTLRAKAQAAKTAFKETTFAPLSEVPKLPSTPTCFVD